MPSIQVNGVTREISQETTVVCLLKSLSLAPAVCLVELNGTVLLRSDFPSTTLEDGDKIEVFRVSAGG